MNRGERGEQTVIADLSPARRTSETRSADRGGPANATVTPPACATGGLRHG